MRDFGFPARHSRTNPYPKQSGSRNAVAVQMFTGSLLPLKPESVMTTAGTARLRAYPKTPPVGFRVIWGHLRPVLRRESST